MFGPVAAFAAAASVAAAFVVAAAALASVVASAAASAAASVDASPALACSAATAYELRRRNPPRDSRLQAEGPGSAPVARPAAASAAQLLAAAWAGNSTRGLEGPEDPEGPGPEDLEPRPSAELPLGAPRSSARCYPLITSEDCRQGKKACKYNRVCLLLFVV